VCVRPLDLLNRVETWFHSWRNLDLFFFLFA